MRNRKRSVALIFLLAMSMLGAAFVALASNKSDPFNYTGVDWQSGLAGRVPMPELDEDAAFSEISGGGGASIALTPDVGSWAYDWYLGNYMQLRGIGEFVEVWVADDVDLMFAPGDPRNDDPKNWQITDEMVEYLVDEFDTNIYPSCVDAFGAPADRDGTGTIFEAIGWPSFTYDWIETDQPQRVILKIFNIFDDNYFNPTYPSYVVGFYNSLYTQNYYNRNMIHIDNWRWWQRLGDEGTQWYPDTYPELTVTRPHVYESTVAHEYQHNIHSDWNPDDPSFMNEGCSMYAEVVSGYGVDAAYFNYYFYSPDNSLTEWSDQGNINILADYGVAALWTIYLSDHYGGGDFVRHFVQSGIPGIDGINDALSDFGFKKTFDDVYHDWRIANLIRSGDGIYNYISIDLNTEEYIDTMVHEIADLPVYPTTGTDFGPTITILGYNTGKSTIGAYGSDYIHFTDWESKNKRAQKVMFFDGDDNSIFGWEEIDDNLWYSGAGNLMNTLLVGETIVVPVDATLDLTTYWDIEEDWDFGFVQISTDGGNTWTSLENEDTSSVIADGGHPDIEANLPGLTGYSGGVVDIEFDLTAYAGQTVQVGFRYMTDWFVVEEGWYIFGAAVNGEPLSLTPVGVGPEVDFQVSFIYMFESNGEVWYEVRDMNLADPHEIGVNLFRVTEPDSVFMIVSPTMTVGSADYTFMSLRFRNGK
ncbi:MAG: hypothetical protein ACW97Z_17605 [Candidatus Hodarchaeales archaeon]|jgi:hypothetical protein